jgi:hypothetical protein
MAVTIGAAILLGLKRSTPLWNDQVAAGLNFCPGNVVGFDAGGHSHPSHRKARSTCSPAASTSARRPVLADFRISSAAKSQCGLAFLLLY